jgi:hypothetical protein
MAILIAVLAAGVILIAYTIMRTLLKSGNRGEAAVLRKDEVAASAKIMSITDTGSRFNYNPVVKLRVEVQPESGASFQAEVKTAVSVVDLPAFQPGAVVRAKYKLNKPSSLVIIGR